MVVISWTRFPVRSLSSKLLLAGRCRWRARMGSEARYITTARTAALLDGDALCGAELID